MELLTVIAIIGLLVALLLPAVQAAREAARRQQCQNNLRQIALSVINYTDSRQGKLPSLWYTDRAEPWGNFAWRANVLPFLESSPLFDSLDFDQPPLSPANREGRRDADTDLSVPIHSCGATTNTIAGYSRFWLRQFTDRRV